MDMKSAIAALSYADARPATAPKAPDGGDMGSGFVDLAQDFAATLKRGEDTAKASMIGDADPHALVQALAQTELAVETAVAVRDRVVEAYQEILRMPV
ncbi:MAG: flagellar hook-basal body complex protein FliE [Rhodobacteraceae bacterium]|jgi:flagellar hook-basal body complex protein FliE|nr:flagellar hook-basal body complex protein FliE [Paracoccaceae bacterium]